MVSAGPPAGEVEIPDAVRRLAGDDVLEPVWRNELGGLTFRATGPETRYLKWQPFGGLTAEQRADVDLVAEADKLRWAGRLVPVPRVLDTGTANGAAWLVTAGIHGISAVDARWRDEPEVAVRAIARGLRRLHDALPVDHCPYRGSWLGDRAHLAPEPDRLVVCHGDPCVPNTLMSEVGEFAGHVDLARLGVADRWADLAIATASIGWDFNFGQNYDDLFFETYGVAPDYDRINVYRELWDAPNGG